MKNRFLRARSALANSKRACARARWRHERRSGAKARASDDRMTAMTSAAGSGAKARSSRPLWGCGGGALSHSKHGVCFVCVREDDGYARSVRLRGFPVIKRNLNPLSGGGGGGRRRSGTEGRSRMWTLKEGTRWTRRASTCLRVDWCCRRTPRIPTPGRTSTGWCPTCGRVWAAPSARTCWSSRTRRPRPTVSITCAGDAAAAARSWSRPAAGARTTTSTWRMCSYGYSCSATRSCASTSPAPGSIAPSCCPSHPRPPTGRRPPSVPLVWWSSSRKARASRTSSRATPVCPSPHIASYHVYIPVPPLRRPRVTAFRPPRRYPRVYLVCIVNWYKSIYPYDHGVRIYSSYFCPVKLESPTIRTVSNGSSIYSVMYAGSGNKITIKRKAAATEDTETSQQETDGSQHSSVGGVKCIPSSHLRYGTPSEKKSSKSSKVISNRYSVKLIYDLTGLFTFAL